MTWITYKASDIGFNGQFGGSKDIAAMRAEGLL